MTLGRRVVYAGIAVGAVALVVGFGMILSSHAQPAVAVPPYRLASFTQNDVQVDIGLLKDKNGENSGILLATYRPLRENFHLYSKDLAPEGIDGVGRPTLLEIPAQDSLKAIGVVSESAPTQKITIDGVDGEFPVYPDGAVTLSVPVAITGSSGTVSITYMACSKTGCLAPVMGKVVTVKLP